MNEPVLSNKKRVASIDLLRGIVMVIMALDHTRDFFHIDSFQHDPLNPVTTTVPLFFTRFITHFCAPVFVFLAGTSAYLSGLRKTKAQLASFLVKRGLWLIAVEIVLVTLILSFNPLYNMIFLQVIWATGISMVILGLLVRLPYKWIFILGAIIVLAHNGMDYPEATWQHQENFFWHLIHDPRRGIFPYAPGHAIIVFYPFLPWTGVMLLGYATGKLFEPAFPAIKRKKILVAVGMFAILLFVILRTINGYGDPSPRMPQTNAESALFSFLSVTKYPPSLMYLCITLGPSLVLLAYLENIHNRVASFFAAFGRVPFFYYLVHFFIIHCVELVAFYLSGHGSGDIVDKNSPFLFRPASFGFPLWTVYLIWITIILVIYPLCKRYNQYKSTHHYWWLSYL